MFKKVVFWFWGVSEVTERKREKVRGDDFAG
jgi:hypothetical protein